MGSPGGLIPQPAPAAWPPVHVYTLPARFNTDLTHDQLTFEKSYQVEQIVHRQLERLSVPPAQARLFYVPVYATAYFHARFRTGASREEATDATRAFVSDAIRHVAATSRSAWARAARARGAGAPLGRDHVIAWAHDFGRCWLAPPEAARAIGIQITGDPRPGDGQWGGAQLPADAVGEAEPDAEADGADRGADAPAGALCFVRGWDIVVPPLLDGGGDDVGGGAPAPSGAAPLAVFRGRCARLERGYSFGVRQALWRDFGARSSGAVRLTDGGADDRNDAEYQSELSSAPFCLAPPGHARWSARAYEAVRAGCVPVLFETETDEAIEYPWQAQGLNYSRFSLVVGAGQVGGLAAQLRAAAPRHAQLRAALLAEARPALLWSHAGGGGPFDRLMVELGRRADEIVRGARANATAARA